MSYNERIIYGLSNIHYSIDGTNIKPLLGAVDVSVTFKEDNLYGNIHGVKRIKLSKSVEGEGTLNILGLTFQEMKDILGYKGELGEIYMQDNFNPQYITLLFTREKANGEKLLNVLYKCKFDITDLSAKTITDAVEQENVELKFKCTPDENRHNLQYFILDTEYGNKDKVDNFFKIIQLPTNIDKEVK